MTRALKYFLMANRRSGGVPIFAYRSGGIRGGGARKASAFGGKVIAVSHPLLAGVARGHAIATVVKKASHQQSVRSRAQGLVIVLLFAQLNLNCIEEFLIEDGQLLPGQDLTFECNLPKVEAIAQQIRHTAACERNAADGLACFQGTELGNNALLAQIAHEGGE